MTRIAEQQKLSFMNFQAQATRRNDMCLVYVGVEDGVPYPKDADSAVKEWLEKNSG